MLQSLDSGNRWKPGHSPRGIKVSERTSGPGVGPSRQRVEGCIFVRIPEVGCLDDFFCVHKVHVLVCPRLFCAEQRPRDLRRVKDLLLVRNNNRYSSGLGQRKGNGLPSNSIQSTLLSKLQTCCPGLKDFACLYIL